MCQDRPPAAWRCACFPFFHLMTLLAGNLIRKIDLHAAENQIIIIEMDERVSKRQFTPLNASLSQYLF